MCGKYFRRKHWMSKHMQINHKHILVPSWRYQDSIHLLQNPKVPKSVIGFNNHAQRSTPPYYLDVDNPLRSIRPPKSQSQSNIFFKHQFVPTNHTLLIKQIITIVKLLNHSWQIVRQEYLYFGGFLDFLMSKNLVF